MNLFFANSYFSTDNMVLLKADLQSYNS